MNNVIEVLGKTNREIINTVIMDIIGNSINQPYIKMSNRVYDAINELKRFNYENVYNRANSSDDLEKYELMFRTLFKKYLRDVKEKNNDSDIYQIFLGNMDDRYLINSTDEQQVIDYIAGMTDDYFINQYEKIKEEV